MCWLSLSEALIGVGCVHLILRSTGLIFEALIGCMRMLRKKHSTIFVYPSRITKSVIVLYNFHSLTVNMLSLERNESNDCVITHVWGMMIIHTIFSSNSTTSLVYANGVL